ncbi:Ser/Thr protein phosphatase, putative [Trichomonas vaginalis G3]|uniref:Serine/threonine-protein phosphatase n=1 Tax=Trichomonas vaginalis (strain ATCC PRA-98 / G3) TaxID=412133 RepID=A2FGA9_TRIV3|nr:phosphoprotein phosphatase protein [Trichomonas vaginalis G3]EAX96055.1 Ser/Thr protein phosphatase, putative [Trichomonas vaginalis G3]KAI5503999.1 phosphoprotein phosphatase protein [Trichomonas vaginalis G3]|eukprot:XP_001308985.1 Ser/Thr protein phosphatase [Trichomonas vaginalis G3]
MSKQLAERIIQQILPDYHEIVSSSTLPSTEDMIALVKETKKILAQEKTIISLTGDFEVVGDLHGDLESLVTIFEFQGYPNEQKYVFLGDYVDRGTHSIHVVLLLFALKCLYPENVFLIRGNHELSSVCKKYDFRQECITLVGKGFYSHVIKAFKVLPLGAVINKKVFCCHGGIPVTTEMTLEELSDVERPFTSEFSDIQNSLLWSDPSNDVSDYDFNRNRRAGELFGRNALDSFFSLNGLDTLIRGHQVAEDGYAFSLGEDVNCITVFSSADHEKGNKGATITVCQDNSIMARQFEKELYTFDTLDYFKDCITKQFCNNSLVLV